MCISGIRFLKCGTIHVEKSISLPSIRMFKNLIVYAAIPYLSRIAELLAHDLEYKSCQTASRKVTIVQSCQPEFWIFLVHSLLWPDNSKRQ